MELKSDYDNFFDSTIETDAYNSSYFNYELENLLKIQYVSKEKIIELAKVVLEYLKITNQDVAILNNILKNYIQLLEKNYPEYKQTFINCGYHIINNQVEKNLELTPNMIVFDCYVIKDFLKLNSIKSFDFYDDSNNIDTFGFYQNGNIRINKCCIRKIYEMYSNKKIALQYLFFAIGHELEHALGLEYTMNYKQHEINLKNVLRVYNSMVAENLQKLINQRFYQNYHDNFAHEHDCNVVGMQILYDRYKWFPCITDDDKREFNKILASMLFDAYKIEMNGEIVYISPVEFTRMNIEQLKEKLPKNIEPNLLFDHHDLTSLLKTAEENLSEEEKLMLGYNTYYIGILRLVANGTLTSTNLLKDLPILYRENYDLIDGKYSYFDNSIEKKWSSLK